MKLHSLEIKEIMFLGEFRSVIYWLFYLPLAFSALICDFVSYNHITTLYEQRTLFFYNDIIRVAKNVICPVFKFDFSNIKNWWAYANEDLLRSNF